MMLIVLVDDCTAFRLKRMLDGDDMDVFDFLKMRGSILDLFVADFPRKSKSCSRFGLFVAVFEVTFKLLSMMPA